MVKLRTLQHSDASKMALMLNQKSLWDNMRDNMPYPYTETDAVYFINLSIESKAGINFAILYKNDFCSVIGVKPQTDVHRKSVEIGYWIGQAYWNKGIATQAVKLMTQWVFEHLNVNRIFARVFAFNVASQKVLLKNHYRQEATLKQAVYKNGIFVDEFIFAKLKPENDIY